MSDWIPDWIPEWDLGWDPGAVDCRCPDLLHGHHAGCHYARKAEERERAVARNMFGKTPWEGEEDGKERTGRVSGVPQAGDRLVWKDGEGHYFSGTRFRVDIEGDDAGTDTDAFEAGGCKFWSTDHSGGDEEEGEDLFLDH